MPRIFGVADFRLRGRPGIINASASRRQNAAFSVPFWGVLCFALRRFPPHLRGGLYFVLGRLPVCFVAFLFHLCSGFRFTSRRPCPRFCRAKQNDRRSKMPERCENPSVMPAKTAERRQTAAKRNSRENDCGNGRHGQIAVVCKSRRHIKNRRKSKRKGGRNFPCRPAHRRQMLLSILKR